MQTTPLESQQLYWSQQQHWGGPVQQWPYAESYHYGDYTDYTYAYYGNGANPTWQLPETQGAVENDSARMHILAMVGAWDAMKPPPMSPSKAQDSLTPEDPGVDAPPLSRDDLLRFRKA